jgi:enoyl-CoA hydratase
MRVVEESAVLGVFCRRWGVPLIDGGTVRLPRIVGLGRAFDLILTGRSVDAQEAKAIGLADRVVPDGSSRAAAEELARELAAFPQPTLRADRLSVYEGTLEAEFARGSQVLDEARRGAARFAGLSERAERH